MTRILLGHGGGGRLSRDLIEAEILPRFGALRGLPDAASLPAVSGGLMMSTDGFVVQPLEFPGGNIGHLAVHGTCNDLAVAGACPRWLSLAMVLEEGLEIAVLRRVLDAVVAACDECGVQVVTGDTKVVPRGQCDGIYLTTAGVGAAMPEFDLDPARIEAGDQIIVSGTLGDHGMAVLCAREGFEIETAPKSDTGPVFPLVQAAASFGKDIKFMRDPTRGGLATLLSDVADECTIRIREPDLPLNGATRSVAELMGIDLLHVACEGRVVAFCSPSSTEALLKSWRDRPEGRGAQVVGQVETGCGQLLLETSIGGQRSIEVPRGEILARIC